MPSQFRETSFAIWARRSRPSQGTAMPFLCCVWHPVKRRPHQGNLHPRSGSAPDHWRFGAVVVRGGWAGFDDGDGALPSQPCNFSSPAGSGPTAVDAWPLSEPPLSPALRPSDPPAKPAAEGGLARSTHWSMDRSLTTGDGDPREPSRSGQPPPLAFDTLLQSMFILFPFAFHPLRVHHPTLLPPRRPN